MTKQDKGKGKKRRNDDSDPAPDNIDDVNTGPAADSSDNDSEEGVRHSTRPHKKTDDQQWKEASTKTYYPRKPKFSPVGDHEASELSPPIVVFFNAKGGTLKSTHTWNTAHTLSSDLRGLKVLTVDMDSQQDLSRSMLKKKLRDQAEANGEQPIGMFEHLAKEFTQGEVDAYANHDLHHADQAYGRAGLARTLERALEPMTWASPFVRRAVPEQITDRLFLLPGSPVIEDIDRRMTISESQLQHSAVQRNWQGAPLHVIMDAAKLVNADIVLLDLNPSLSTINRNMLMSSDYIVVTTRPEEYSLENMDTFINKMTRNDLSADMYGGSWLQQMIHNVRREVNFKHANQPPRFPLPTTVPKVLGCVIADYSSQRNVERTMNPARPPDFLSTQVNGVFHDHAASAIQFGMNSITTRMGVILNTISNIQVVAPPGPMQANPVPVQMTIGREVYEAARLTCLLAKIRNYESLGPLTHYTGVPAPFIGPELCVDVETGNPLPPANKKTMLHRAADFKRRYDQLAFNILKLMNGDPGGKLYGRLDWALVNHRDTAGGPTRTDDGCQHSPYAPPGY